MEKKFLYCIDENLCATLLSKEMKLLNTISDTSNRKIWIFEYNPSLFLFDLNDIEVKKKCFFSDSLKMIFS